MDSLLNIPHQIGTFVLDLDGNILNSSGDLSGEQSIQLSHIIKSLVADCGELNFLKTDAPEDESLERLIISFPGYQYVIGFDHDVIHVIKQEVEDH